MSLLVVAMLQAAVPAPAFRTIDKGTQSGVNTARQVTIHDRDAWTTLWHTHASTRPQPEIDFSKEMVLGVFMGGRSTGGYAVEIVAVRVRGENITVEYRETMPDPDAITAQVLVSPYHLVAVPNRSGSVTFERK